MWSVPGSQPWSRTSPGSLPIREDLRSFDSELASDKTGARGRLVIPPSHGGGNGHHLLPKPSPAPRRLRPVPQLPPNPAAARPPPSQRKCSITVSNRGTAAGASEEALYVRTTGFQAFLHTGPNPARAQAGGCGHSWPDSTQGLMS